MSVKEVSEAMGIPEKTIYEWMWAWNRERYEGAKRNPPSRENLPSWVKRK
jgi:transposase